jgi:hypothetical protein
MSDKTPEELLQELKAEKLFRDAMLSGGLPEVQKLIESLLMQIETLAQFVPIDGLYPDRLISMIPGEITKWDKDVSIIDYRVIVRDGFTDNDVEIWSDLTAYPGNRKHARDTILPMFMSYTYSLPSRQDLRSPYIDGLHPDEHLHAIHQLCFAARISEERGMEYYNEQFEKTFIDFVLPRVTLMDEFTARENLRKSYKNTMEQMKKSKRNIPMTPKRPPGARKR